MNLTHHVANVVDRAGTSPGSTSVQCMHASVNLRPVCFRILETPRSPSILGKSEIWEFPLFPLYAPNDALLLRV